MIHSGYKKTSRKIHCRHGHEYTSENTYVSPEGDRRYCKECNKRRVRERWNTHRENVQVASWKWRAANPEKVQALRFRRYGLSIGDVSQMLEEQHGRCAICYRKFGNYCVDHDHSTGRVRGLLCYQCNQGLGKLRDNFETVRAAADYLIKVEWACLLLGKDCSDYKNPDLSGSNST